MTHRFAKLVAFCVLLALSGMDCHGGKTEVRPLKPATHAQTAPVPLHALHLYVSTRMWNTLEPCGCTSTPLGGIARLATLLHQVPEQTRFLDAGGLRYEPIALPAERQPQARLKADFLEKTWGQLGALTAIQPEDLRNEPEAAIQPGFRRVCANLSGLPKDALVPHAVQTALGFSWGVIGLADPSARWPASVSVTDPEKALSQQLAALSPKSLAFTVVLAALPRDRVRKLARTFSQVKLWVVGADDSLPDGVAQPETVGESLLLVPGKKGERVFHVTLHLSSQNNLVWRPVPTEAQRQDLARKLTARAQTVSAQLASLRADPSADPTFVKTQQDDLASLRKQIDSLAAPAPVENGFVTAELVPLSRAIPSDQAVRAAMDELEVRIGQANVRVVSAPPPPPAPSEPSYIGNTACLGACHYHEPAHAVWQNTQHGRAFRTLTELRKHLSYDCVHCHSTGFGQPGGSNLFTLDLWENATTPPKVAPDLRHVGCEVCHGPGSLHVQNPGKVRIPTPKPDQDTCLSCHTPEHSDTFEWKAYARSILGEGHGANTQKALGPGPTAKTLRKAAQKEHGH
ncbi:MAG TPA: cytochrome c family protein [Pseudomonadota bacterium]|nr:cytochrome c family protein [Pseudomonadota bacterium]